MAILVTGATGTGGRDVADRLVSVGEQVRRFTVRPLEAGLRDHRRGGGWR